MVKRIACRVLLAAFALLLAFPVLSLADDRPMVVDLAELYTDSEEAQMAEIITRIRAKYQIDMVVLTTYDVPEAYGDDSVTVRYADEWYEQNGYGIGDDLAGALLITDMTNRFNYISTCGVMIDYMSDSRIEEVLDAWDEQVEYSQGRAMIAELNAVEGILAKGIEEGHFRYDDVTGERLPGLYNKLTGGEAAVAGIAGLAAGGAVAGAINRRYKLKYSTYRYNSEENAGLQLTEDNAVLIGQHVTHTKIVSENKTGSGGLGGFSGGGRGSGVHISSGGHSHGGGGHHF